MGKFWNMWTILILHTAFLVMAHGGNSDPASQLVVLDKLPKEFDNVLQSENHKMIIRTNFTGAVEFIESDDFHIDVNITSPNVEELAKVHYQYTDYNGAILLQLYSKEPKIIVSPIPMILLAIGGATLLALLVSSMFVCWWNSTKKHIVNSKKFHNLDESQQAPLLEGRTSHDLQDNKNQRRRKKHRQPHSIYVDEYGSSEDEILREKMRKSKEPSHGTRYAYPPTTKVRSLRSEAPIVSSDTESNTPTPHNMSMEDHLTPLPPPPPEKPIVSYIKLQPDVAERGNKNYNNQQYQKVGSDHSDGGYSDIDSQTTLKARSEDRYNCGSDPMPDVIRSQSQASRQTSLDTHSSRDSDYEHPLYSQVNKPRYKTEVRDTVPPSNANYNEGELQRIFNSPPPIRENEYSNINKSLSGAHIAHILTDKNKGSPKYSHNTNRPPTTFSKLPQREPNLEQVELDSVGSSRSGESSKSSGVRTQSSYTDSTYGSDKRAPVFTDSDSAHSTSSSANRSRDSGLHGGIRYYIKHPSQEADTDDHFPSPSASDPSSTSSSSPRLVDEAYGTMMASNSNGNGSMNGNNTLRSSSASTGSGSSGSVVTVINNDDPTGLGGRKRVYFKQRQSPAHANGNGSLERRTGGGGGGMPPHYLQTSILCCLSLICLATGVYTYTEQETHVTIKVYTPFGYIKSVPEVYTRDDKDVIVSTNIGFMEVIHYEVADTYMEDTRKNLCLQKNCQQHCDPNTGECVCKHGYIQRFKSNGDSMCEDRDECLKKEYTCDKNAHCVNYNGYYNCACNVGFYGDGKQCFSCNADCLPGSFELRGCNDPASRKQKVCEECRKFCTPGEYIAQNCTRKSNTQCKVCRSRCERKEFEYRPCDNEGSKDRECRSVDTLPSPTFSKNIPYYENQRDLSDELSYVLHQNPSDSDLTNVLVISRGDFTITISMTDSNLAARFRAVDHSESNDNTGFSGDKTILTDYCPYPVPEKYTLELMRHKGMTTKALFYDCNKVNKTGERCDSETGYYLNPKQPCESYTKFGRLPVLNPDGWSIICTKPGKLSQMFQVDSELEDVTTMFVDKTVKCAEQRTNCDSCSVRCARQMKEHRGSNRCNITGEDSDNGESPRLPYCYACANEKECSKMCEVYHNPECDRTRCVTGNILEFVLQPSWHHSKTIFGCHIEPVPGYTIYDLEVKVDFKNKPVTDKTLYYKKTYKDVHPARAKAIHDFLVVYYGSEVVGSPNLIEGDTEKSEYSAGYYQANGSPLTESKMSSTPTNVRPRMPFQISTKLWKQQNCNTDILNNIVLTDSISPVSPSADSYRQESALRVQYADRGEYKIYNRSSNEDPFIYFEIPADKSLLAALFDPTTVRDDGTLKAEITRKTGKWNLVINGELNTCPGYFNIKVQDPLYPKEQLFNYDVGVTCPKAFTVTFHIPTAGSHTYEKRLLVEIKDSYRTIKMTVVKPRPQVSMDAEAFFWSNKTDNSNVSYSNKGEVEMTVFTPFTAVLGVVISSLLLLLCIGFITDTGKPNRKSDNKVHGQHLVFVVGYVTFRTAYSVAVTFTILVLIIRYVNREPLNTLVEFGRYAETGENSQNQEIQKIQHYVLQELHRQNERANQTKLVCERKLQLLQGTLEKTKEEMIIENNEEKLISQVALDYTKIMIMNLTNDITKFKKNFATYASKSMEKLTRNIVETASALQSNKWLAGAKVIYDNVSNKRRSQGQSTKQFLDWLGLKQEVDRLSEDLSLKDFPMPDIQDFLNMEKPRVNNHPSPLPKIQDITLPKNQWYFHNSEKLNAEDGSQSNSKHLPGDGEVKGTRNTIINWSTCLIVLIVIDAVWFIHRMAKTYTTAKMMLYGCPTFIDCKKPGTNSRSPDNNSYNRPLPTKCFHFIKDLNLRIMKTEFVPKLVATVTTCCALYFVLGVADKLLTVKALASVGYIESLVAPVETTYQLAKTRTKTNAYRINKFEYPFYEELVNMRTKRYQLMLNMYAEVQKTTNLLHDSEYCAWKQMLSPGVKCNCTSATAPKLSFEGCELAPVTPKPYVKRDFGAYRDKLAKSVVPYLNAARGVVKETCHLILLFVAVLVLVDALGAVIWIYFKRFNLLRLKPMFEVEHFPAPTANHS